MSLATDASIAASVGAREHIANLLKPEQSREVFVHWSKTELTKLPPVARELIQQCAGLPLALSMIGAMVRGKPVAYWKTVLDNLRQADLERSRRSSPTTLWFAKTKSFGFGYRRCDSRSADCQFNSGTESREASAAWSAWVGLGRRDSP